MKCAAEANPDIFLGSIKSLLTLSLSELSFLKNVSTYSNAIKDRADKIPELSVFSRIRMNGGPTLGISQWGSNFSPFHFLNFSETLLPLLPSIRIEWLHVVEWKVKHSFLKESGRSLKYKFLIVGISYVTTWPDCHVCHILTGSPLKPETMNNFKITADISHTAATGVEFFSRFTCQSQIYWIYSFIFNNIVSFVRSVTGRTPCRIGFFCSCYGVSQFGICIKTWTLTRA